MKQPIFEIIYEDNHYKIYENGTIEGFPDGGCVVNKIQIVLAQRIAKWIESAQNQWDESERNKLTGSRSPARKATLSRVGSSQGAPL